MHKNERVIKAGNETMTVSGHEPEPESEWMKEYEAQEQVEKDKVADHEVDVDAYRKNMNNRHHSSYRR